MPKQLHIDLLSNTLLGIAGGIQLCTLRKASATPAQSQEKVLRKILEYGKDTVFGTEHKFAQILEAEDFPELCERYRKNVTPAEYESFRPYVNSMKDGEGNVLFPGHPRLYATTSGSTNEPKWIPISDEYLKDIYGKMNKAWLCELVRNRRLAMSGKVVRIIGRQIEGYTPDGTIFGSVSGFTSSRCPGFIRKKYTSPPEVFDIEDYTARNYLIMRMGIEQNVSLCVAANPSSMVEMQHTVDTWLDEFITDIENGTITDKVNVPVEVRKACAPYIKPNPQRAAELRSLKASHSQVTPKYFWPDLQILSTWKCGNTSIYIEKLKGCFPDGILHQEFAYFSSECRAGIVIDDSISTCLFPHMHFYEFKKADEFDNPDAPFYCLDQLEEGGLYCPFVSTFSGLYRYNMNDIVMADSPYVNTPRIHMVQKVNGIVNLTGEKLYEGQFIGAVESASAASGLEIEYFCAYADTQRSAYDWFFEFKDSNIGKDRISGFAKLVDNKLKAANIEYEAKRNSFRLKDPGIHILPLHSFDLFKREVLDSTNADASRFKPNVLSQRDEYRKIMLSISTGIDFA